MTLKGVARDENGVPLPYNGTEPIFDVRSLATDWVPLQFAHDIKGITISVLSGTVYFDSGLGSSKAWFNAAPVVDNADGTVTIASTAHGFADGSEVTIIGTTFYDGIYDLETASATDTLVITPDPHVAVLDEVAAVDATGGKVFLFAAGHDFLVGDTVTISGTTNYNGSHVLQTGTIATKLKITATYVAETIGSGAKATGFVQEVFPATTAYALGHRYPSLASGAGLFLPLAIEANTTVCSVKSASTGAISILAWR